MLYTDETSAIKYMYICIIQCAQIDAHLISSHQSLQAVFPKNATSTSRWFRLIDPAVFSSVINTIRKHHISTWEVTLTSSTQKPTFYPSHPSKDDILSFKTGNHKHAHMHKSNINHCRRAVGRGESTRSNKDAASDSLTDTKDANSQNRRC